MGVACLSTEHVEPRHQFDAWREWFSPILDIDPLGRDTESFVASNRAWDLGGPVVSRVSAPPVLVRRTKANLARAPADHWMVSCCRQGSSAIQTGRGLLHARPGAAFVWSLGEVSESQRSQVDRIQILLPRDAFPELSEPLDALCGSVVAGELGATLASYMLAMEQWLPNVAADALPQLGAAVGSMVAACVAPSSERLHRVADEMDGFRVARARAAIQRHLTSPELRPELLCRMLGISRSALYRLFGGRGGVMRYIQRQRLQYAYGALADPNERRSILALSEELGFGELSSFSRAFRREFGCSPRDARSAAAAGGGIEAALPGTALKIGCFEDLLRHPDHQDRSPVH